MPHIPAFNSKKESFHHDNSNCGLGDPNPAAQSGGRGRRQAAVQELQEARSRGQMSRAANATEAGRVR